MSIRPRVARRLRPGDQLQPRTPGEEGKHVVTAINPDPHLPTHLLIKTNRGEWSCDLDKMFTFPRRDDGSTVNWLEEDRDPKTHEICVGDTLPPVTGRDKPWLEPYSDSVATRLRLMKLDRYEDLPAVFRNEIEQEWYLSRQEVTGVWCPSGDLFERRLTCYDPTARTTRTYIAHVHETLTFPRKTFGGDLQPRVETGEGGTRLVRVYGPYEIVAQEWTFLIAIHPSGRGRWPSWISEWEESIAADPDQRLHIVRPPAGDWKKFIFMGENDPLPEGAIPDEYVMNYMRHPKDPKRMGR